MTWNCAWKCSNSKALSPCHQWRGSDPSRCGLGILHTRLSRLNTRSGRARSTNMIGRRTRRTQIASRRRRIAATRWRGRCPRVAPVTSAVPILSVTVRDSRSAGHHPGAPAPNRMTDVVSTQIGGSALRGSTRASTHNPACVCVQESTAVSSSRCGVRSHGAALAPSRWHRHRLRRSVAKGAPAAGHRGTCAPTSPAGRCSQFAVANRMALPSWLTAMVCPGVKRPSSNALASGLSSAWAMARFRGRAPKTGS